MARGKVAFKAFASGLENSEDKGVGDELGRRDDGSELRCTWVTQERPEGTAHLQKGTGTWELAHHHFLFCTFPSSLCSRERQL